MKINAEIKFIIDVNALVKILTQSDTRAHFQIAPFLLRLIKAEKMRKNKFLKGMFDRIAYRELSRSDSRYFKIIRSKHFCQFELENFTPKYYF